MDAQGTSFAIIGECANTGDVKGVIEGVLVGVSVETMCCKSRVVIGALSCAWVGHTEDVQRFEKGNEVDFEDGMFKRFVLGGGICLWDGVLIGREEVLLEMYESLHHTTFFCAQAEPIGGDAHSSHFGK